MKFTVLYLFSVVMSLFSLSAGEITTARFLYRVDTESVEELADRFSTTPDSISGCRTILLQGNFPENDLRVDLKKGELLSFPDSPPFKVVDLGEKTQIQKASEKLTRYRENMQGFI